MYYSIQPYLDGYGLTVFYNSLKPKLVYAVFIKTNEWQKLCQWQWTLVIILKTSKSKSKWIKICRISSPYYLSKRLLKLLATLHWAFL